MRIRFLQEGVNFEKSRPRNNIVNAVPNILPHDLTGFYRFSGVSAMSCTDLPGVIKEGAKREKVTSPYKKTCIQIRVMFPGSRNTSALNGWCNP